MKERSFLVIFESRRLCIRYMDGGPCPRNGASDVSLRCQRLATLNRLERRHGTAGEVERRGDCMQVRGLNTDSG